MIGAQRRIVSRGCQRDSLLGKKQVQRGAACEYREAFR